MKYTLNEQTRSISILKTDGQNIAIIPARGKSKRIPKKNIKPFFGRPIIAYSIDAAASSGVFHKIIVSTDDPEISKIALELGAQVPFTRPEEISGDHVGIGEVITHALDHLEGIGETYETFCCIHATAPFITPLDIRSGLEKMIAQTADAAFTVAPFEYPIQRALRLNDTGRLAMIEPSNLEIRSQDLEPAYHDAGQFYWARTEAFRQSGRFLMDNSVPVVIPRTRAQDIDTPADWELAEALFEKAKRH